MSVNPFVFLTALCAFSATAVASQHELLEYQKLVARSVHASPAQRIFYDPSETGWQQFGDLRIPKGKGPFPLVIVVHGGGWMAFSTVDYMTPVADALTCAGVATWNIEFSRVGTFGEWPEMFKDLGKATDYVRTLARDYPIDPARVVSMGHSSGAHLALWMAARSRLPRTAELYSTAALPIRGVVAISGVGDLEQFIEEAPQYVPQVHQLLGVQDEEKSRGDLLQKRMREVSPVELLPLGVPQIIIQGRGDTLFRPQWQERYVATARTKSDDVKLVMISGGHFETVDPLDAEGGPAILAATASLLGERMDNEQARKCFARDLRPSPAATR